MIVSAACSTMHAVYMAYLESQPRGCRCDTRPYQGDVTDQGPWAGVKGIVPAEAVPEDCDSDI